ncbi:MAG: OsmC family protein [Bacteroidota bacterium]
MNNVENKVLNGVNVTQLIGTIDAVKDNPSIATFKFRSNTKWINGGHCQTEIKSFYGATMEDASRTQPFLLQGDEPSILLGTNKGPNAVEAVLHALASCLSVGIVYNAAAMGIEIQDLNFSLEGELDLHAFLGLSEEKRAGYKNILVIVKAETSATDDEFRDLLNHVTKTSPVLDIITNPVAVEIKF